MSKPTFCLFAKPPVPGRSKTRLGRVVGDERAAQLASAFLTDTWNTLGTLDWANRMLSSTVSTGLPVEADVWQQCEGDLGARIEHTLSEALRHGPYAFAIGADSPGLPLGVLSAARIASHENEAVIGPTEDGGYYLLGLQRCPPGLLADLPWSSPDTFRATRARLLEQGFSVAVLERWWDVDEAHDLDRLRDHLTDHAHLAPVTAALLGLSV